MTKRIFDFLVSIIGLLLLAPIILLFMLLVWLQDWHSPFYIAPRVGKNGVLFMMIKLRSMVINADKTGVDSTSNDDKRITILGGIIRRYKLDEITQLLNVLMGKMSLVGPRPQVESDVLLYTKEEKKLLNEKPGITDFSSIIFSDEGKILEGSQDPDLDYNQLIRPWKSRLGLFYIENISFLLDMKLILTTVLSIFSRRKAILTVVRILNNFSAPSELIEVAGRKKKLIPHPPPGSTDIICKIP